jgi:KaiC/GvpD/RAD55 family RecA-like ATPase
LSTLHRLSDLAAAEAGRVRDGTRAPQGLPSGIRLEQLVAGGLPRGKITTVYSSEGSFKTTVAAQMAVATAQAGFRVLNVTFEDSAQLFAHRYLARLTGVPFGLIHSGTLTEDQRDLVANAKLTRAAQNIVVVDDLETRWERVEAAVHANNGCDLLLVDYIQMLGRDPAMLDNAVFSAQALAKRYNCAVVLVSQRTKIDRTLDNPRPSTDDMFGSSALRMGAKVAVGLFRPWAFCKVPTQVKGPYGPYVRWLSSHPDHNEIYPNLVEVHVTKNFAGPPGAFHIVVNPGTGEITPIRVEGF